MTPAASQPAPRHKEHVNLPCEVCDSPTSRLWRTLRYPAYGHPGSFELRRCDGCHLVFNSPRLEPAALGRLYDRNYYIFQEPVADAFARVAGLHRTTVAQLLTHVGMPAATTLLEVGSAKGYMLALLRDQGWSVDGVELSAHAAQFANDILHVPTYQGTLDAWVADPAHAPRGAAYSTDVIEHVPSPRRFLDALFLAVEPGGYVLIGTPNIESDGMAEHGDRWLGFNPFHIWLFSRGTLSTLLERCGFEVVDAYSFGNVVLEREPPMSPTKRWLRDTLARVGLLGSLRAVRTRRRAADAEADIAARRRAAGRSVAAATSWKDSDDGLHPRAALARGDNLVILARRPPGP